MLCLYDLACDEAIKTKNATWLKELIKMRESLNNFNEHPVNKIKIPTNKDIDNNYNEVKYIDAVRLMLQAGNVLYYRDMVSNTFHEISEGFKQYIIYCVEESFAIQRNIENNIIKFYIEKYRGTKQ